jgi:hypothetical protein
MVKKVGSIHFKDEKLKSIPVCELFFRIAMDIARPLHETRSRNKYILMAINHYSKWCEAKVVVDHGAKTAAIFMEDQIIWRYGVPKFVLINNGGEWTIEFDMSCAKTMGITINIQHFNGHNVMGWLNV